MKVLCACGALMVAAAGAIAQEPPKSQVLQIGDNERVVHVVGTPFNHSYYGDWLETYLLQRYACRGLIFRSVNCGGVGVLRNLDGLVLIHKPTLVVLQIGNDDLDGQYRSQKYSFAENIYARPMEEIVKKLRAAGAKVVLCSVIPRGKDLTKDPKGQLIPPNDGLKTWVDQAREIAAKHGAAFADLFTETVDWPMINTPKNCYGADMHQKSWELLLKQVSFGWIGSGVSMDAKGGQPACQGAAVTDLKTDGGLSFALQNAAGVGPVMLKVAGLAAGNRVVSVNGKPFATKSAADLAAGIDLGLALQTQVGTKEYREEIARGHAAVAAMVVIQNYRLPAWVKVPDVEQQKQAAVEAALADVRTHDEAMRKMVAPKPWSVQIAPAK